MDLRLPPKDMIKWSSDQFVGSVFKYEFLSFKILQAPEDKVPVPVLVVSNSVIVPREVAICLRPFEDYVRLRSLLRHYIRTSQLPGVPEMNKSSVTISIGAFYRWARSRAEILSLSPVQLFIYTKVDINQIEKCFKEGKAIKCLVTGKQEMPFKPEIPTLIQDYERDFLLDNPDDDSRDFLYKFSCLCNDEDVEMAQDEIHLSQSTREIIKKHAGIEACKGST